jgi:NADPH:quinone reductase-like Zn-dependent oxidoreductase
MGMAVTVPTTMMALRAHARGGPEQLVFEQAPVPVPELDEVLVEVHAAGITFAELTWDLSWTTQDGRDRTPVIPSHEVSGIVRGLGENARGFSAGEEVYGLIAFDRDGAAADYVTVPAADITGRPRSVSHVQAASLPLAALTAWQALIDHAGLRSGERVLVQGGAGGVGVYVVQLAAILGADVTATGRAGQGDFVRSLGAQTFTQDAGHLGDEFDVVVDTVGGPVLEASYGLTRRGGRLVTLSAPPSARRAEQLGIDAMFFVVTPDAAELSRLAELTESGQLRPVVSQTFELREGRQAFESGTRPRPPGKTVLIVR